MHLKIAPLEGLAILTHSAPEKIKELKRTKGEVKTRKMKVEKLAAKGRTTRRARNILHLFHVSTRTTPNSNRDRYESFTLES